MNFLTRSCHLAASVGLCCLLSGPLGATVPSRFHQFAQVGDGGGLRSVFLVANKNAEAVTIVLELFASDGAAFPLAIGGEEGSRFERVVPAAGMIRLQTAGVGAIPRAGWARLTADGDVGVQLLFEIRNNASLITQAAVDSSPPLKLFDAFVETAPGTDSGLALANLSSVGSIRVRITLFTEAGGQAFQEEITLGIRQQIARFVSQIFAGLGNFRGTMRVESSGPLAAVVLQQTGLVLGTLPVLETL